MSDHADTQAAELVRALTSEFPPERIVSILSDGCAATVVNRNGSIGVDYRTRMESVRLLLLYRLGKPIERSQIVMETRDGNDDDDQMRLERSPALRRELLKRIYQIEGRPVVDV